MRIFWIVPAVFCVIALLPDPVFADGDPCEGDFWGGEIESLDQVDQDVHIHALLVPGYFMKECGPAYGAPLYLWRINASENKKLFDLYPRLNNMAPFTPSGYCAGYACGEIPGKETCEDCDGDGEDECTAGNCSVYLGEFVDSCAPPGVTQYHYSTYGTDFYDEEQGIYIWRQVCIDRKAIDVTDSGAECPPWNSVEPDETDACSDSPIDDTQPDDDNDTQVDDDNDTQTDDDQIDDSTDDTYPIPDNQADDDNDDDESGCGGCNASGADHQAPLASGMWVIGLAAFIASRRRD